MGHLKSKVVEMKRHLFPLKLHGIVHRLIDSDAIKRRLPPPDITKSPDDGKLRYMLFSSELNASLPEIEGYPNHQLRKRIAIPKDYTFIAGIEDVMFEIYDIKGDLIYSEPVVRVSGYMSAAIEVELLLLLLEVQGVKIDTM
jgi:hypothetical protein